MSYLFAPDQGINQKLKVLYSPDQGVNRKLKALYAPDQGINRKIFSSVLPATYLGSYEYSDVNGYSYGTATSSSNADNISFSGTAGLNNTSLSARQIRVVSLFTLPIDTTSLTVGTPLLEFNGSFTYTNFKNYNYNFYIEIGAGDTYGGLSPVNNWLKRTNILGRGSIGAADCYNGTYTDTVTALCTTAYPGYSYITITFIIAPWMGNSYDYGPATGAITFPWSNLTWLPTGDKIKLAA